MHYDIAIIGTGAGGGTLLHALAGRGKRILVLERGDYVPREKANWNTRAVNVEGRYQTKETWRDRGGRPLHPHTTTTWAATPSSTGPRSSASAARTSARSSTGAGYRPRGRSNTRTSSPTTPRRNGSITCTASGERTRRTRPRARRTRTRR